MKTLLPSIAIVAGLVGLVASSVSAGPNFNIEIKGGMNFAKWHGQDVTDADSRRGFVGGVSFDIPANDWIDIQPELMFSSKGTKVAILGSDSIPNSSGSETIKLNYLEIPLLLELNIETTGSVKPSLFVGPVVSILLSAKSEATTTINVVPVVTDIKDRTKSVDVGFAVGGGLSFPAGSGNLITEVRYTHGFSNVPEIALYDIDQKNSAFSLMVGFSFPLGGR